ncbi:uncharacterized protein G2W53_044395 [Senna tora]|uniref:Uncharacterized protein n=1 Tax=Senna tora TaxID=362788 RepID=A0A834SK90_9FABA|nr:uncharacterized protein G2W53_044395 [Senna tora]
MDYWRRFKHLRLQSLAYHEPRQKVIDGMSPAFHNVPLEGRFVSWKAQGNEEWNGRLQCLFCGMPYS